MLIIKVSFVLMGKNNTVSMQTLVLNKEMGHPQSYFAFLWIKSTRFCYNTLKNIT